MLVTAASASRAVAARQRVAAVRRLATAVDASGFKVAAVDRGEPTTSITVVAKAGSRYEPTPGAAHFLKNFAFKTTGSKSALRTVREAELYGGLLSSSLSREYVTLTAEFLRGDEERFGALLAQVLSSTKYLEHELHELTLPTVAAESTEAASSASVQAIELAHAAAFRHGLGASLYASQHSPVSAETVKEYARSAFSKGNVAVVAQGISADALQHVFQPTLKEAAAPSSAVSKYFGGESRVEGSGHGNAVFIGFGVAGATAPELEVLAGLLSAEPSVKWAKGVAPLAKALPDGASVETVLYSYSDAALFGFLVQGASPAAVRAASTTAVSVLKAVAGAAPAAEDLKSAIAKAQFRAAHAVDGREAFAATVAAGLLGGPSSALENSLAALGKVNAAALTKTASTLIKAKPTFVAVGSASELPYADEVGL